MCLVWCAALALGALTSPAAAQSLPKGWTSTDIGSPAITGSGDGTMSSMTVRGSGAGIDGSSDEFQFTYEKLSGDVDMVMRLDGLDSTSSSAKAGIMIRDTTETYSKHAYVRVSGGRVGFQWRDRNARASRLTNGASVSGAVYLRLVRSRNNLTAYSSSDGTKWVKVGAAKLRMTNDVLVGLAVTSSTNKTVATAGFSSDGSGGGSGGGGTPTELPSPWVASDMGSPALAGSTSYSSGTFSVSGAGADIWGTSDEFQFVYQPIVGDGEIVAYVSSLTTADPWTKAGVTIREGLSASAANAAVFATGSNGWFFQRRLSKGGSTVGTVYGSGNAPGWVRLVREGNLFTGYFSTDGSSWTLLGSDTIEMSGAAYVGLAVTSHNTGALVTSTFKNVTVGAPTGGNKAPSVGITSPNDGATFSAGSNVAITATASDVDGSITKVDFYAGSTLLKSDTTSPYSVTWSGVAAGNYTLKAIATDNAGDSTTSANVSISVGSTNKVPTVSMSSPVAGATFTAPATIGLTASAADTDGSVVKVEFYAGNTLVGSDTSSPFSVTWNNVAAGSYTLKAVATDNNGGTTTSAGVGISVTTSSTSKPSTLTFAPPADYSTNVTSVTVELRKAGTSTTSTPVASKALGKPSVSSGSVTVDITSTVDGLAAGDYYAIVVTKNSMGSTPSSPSPTFTK